MTIRCTLAQQRLLELMAQFFCMSARTGAALLRAREITESDERSVRRTFSILYRQRLVARLPHMPEGRERGGIQYVYGLSRRGVALAHDAGYATGATKTLDEHSLRTLDHELEISAFHIAINRFSMDRSIPYTWRQRDLKRTVHPDALFVLCDPRNPDRPIPYFLEIERAKLGNYRNGEPQIVRKLGKYFAYFDSNDCEKEWGFRKFRVIIVQRTDARREGLLNALQENCRHRMFWLTTEPAYRADIGGEIFKTPRDAAERSYALLGSEASHP